MPGDAGQGRRVDVVALGRAAVPAGDLAGPPPAGVGVGQPGPPRLAQFPGGFGAPVGHEGVKPGHRGLDQPDGGRRERAAGGARCWRSQAASRSATGRIPASGSASRTGVPMPSAARNAAK